MNISFSLTTPQFLDGSKTVTRRLGWRKLKAGSRLMACVKCQGIPKGGKVEKLGEIDVLDVRREPLSRMTSEVDYGLEECKLEGFAELPQQFPSVFVEFFCGANDCKPDDEVARIEFRLVDAGAGDDLRPKWVDEAWKAGPIARACHRTGCDRRTVYAYPAANHGWGELCYECAQKHLPHAWHVSSLVRQGFEMERSA